MRRQHLCSIALFVNIHRHIEMQVDQSFAVKTVNSPFDRIVRAWIHGEGGGGAIDGRSGSSFARGAKRQRRASSQTEPKVNTPGNHMNQRETSTIAIRQ